jgi:phosphoribosylformylglycinamidine (FGAM) synthase-like enzyme
MKKIIAFLKELFAPIDPKILYGETDQHVDMRPYEEIIAEKVMDLITTLPMTTLVTLQVFQRAHKPDPEMDNLGLALKNIEQAQSWLKVTLLSGEDTLKTQSFVLSRSSVTKIADVLAILSVTSTVPVGLKESENIFYEAKRYVNF